jgi:outer membrane protein assembly factor BamB
VSLPSVVTVGAVAQTADGWLQFQRDGGHSAWAPEGPQPPYRERWRLPAPAGVSLSAPVIAGNVAITVGQQEVYGVDPSTGRVVWRVDRAGGPISVPAIAPGGGLLVYVDEPAAAEAPAGETGATATPTPASPTATAAPSPSPTQAEGATAPAEVVALDLASRDERWRTPLAAVSTTPVTIDAGTAFVGDADGNVTALSLDDGSIEWSFDVGGRFDTALAASDGAVVAVAPTEERGTVAITAIDGASGEQRWSQPFRLGSAAASSPAIADGTIFVGLPDRQLHALSLEDGTERWTAIGLSVFSPVTAPAVADGIVAIADLAGGVYARAVDDGSRVWRYQLNEPIVRGSPARSGDVTLVGLSDGRLVAIGPDGHLVWQSEPEPGLIGAMALGSDVVIAVKGGEDAGLIAFEHDPDGTLVDVASPTQLDPGATLPRVGAAAAIALVLALVPGILARRRFGDAFAPVDDEVEDDDLYDDGGDES